MRTTRSEKPMEGNPQKRPSNGGMHQKTAGQNICQRHALSHYLKILGGIYSQGGICDRCVATILERRLSLTHSTMAGGKMSPSVIPQPIYISGGCANPYHSYVREAPQTLIIIGLAGPQKAQKKRPLRNPKKDRGEPQNTRSKDLRRLDMQGFSSQISCQ